MTPKKILIGTDVLMDLVFKKDGNQAAKTVFNMAESGLVSGYVASHSIVKLIEKASRADGRIKDVEAVRSVIGIIQTMLTVIDTRKTDISAALNRINARKSFEANLLLALREQYKLDFVVSDREEDSRKILSTKILITKIKENNKS